MWKSKALVDWELVYLLLWIHADKTSEDAKNMQTTCGAVSQGQRREIDWQFLPDPLTAPL